MWRAFLLFLGLAATPALADEEPKSSFEQREIELEDFSSIRLEAPFRTSVFPTRSATEGSSAFLIGPPEMLANVVAEVVDGTLHLRWREGIDWSWNPGAGVNVVVRTPPLSKAAIGGAGSIDLWGVDPEGFEAEIGGAGQMKIEAIDTKRLGVAVGGAGSVTAFGTSDSVSYALGGAGSIEAKRLRARTADIALGGAGSIYADVSEQASIAVGGAGRVEVVGGASCTYPPESADNIDCR